MTNQTINRPLISVVIEGYNDSLDQGTAKATVEALKEQDFPLEKVELILIGTDEQAESWRQAFAGETSFSAIKTVGATGSHYYELKNKGADAATAEILAMLDSDVKPENNWLSAIYRGITEKQADVVAGISLFRDENDLRTSQHPFLQTAASISWGFVIPPTGADQISIIPNAFLSHNLGIRIEVFQQHRYRTDLGRTCAGSFLFNSLRAAGAKMLLQPEQRIAHNFTLWWWLSRLHLRFGYEIYQLRRIDQLYPNKLAAKFGIFEPVACLGWQVLNDVPRWFRFSKLMKVNQVRRTLLLPVAVSFSVAARTSEMIGMYLTMFSPAAMKRRAERS